MLARLRVMNSWPSIVAVEAAVALELLGVEVVVAVARCGSTVAVVLADLDPDELVGLHRLAELGRSWSSGHADATTLGAASSVGRMRMSALSSLCSAYSSK